MPLAVLDRSRFPDRRHALPMARHALALGSDSRHEALAASARAGSRKDTGNLLHPHLAFAQRARCKIAALLLQLRKGV